MAELCLWHRIILSQIEKPALDKFIIISYRKDNIYYSFENSPKSEENSHKQL
jgi:hypothetical protein